MSLSDTIYCELCGLPHLDTRAGSECDNCTHVLGTPVNELVMLAEMAQAKRKIAQGLIPVLLLTLLNAFLIRGGGILYLFAFPPLMWMMWGIERYRFRARYFRQKKRAQTEKNS